MAACYTCLVALTPALVWLDKIQMDCGELLDLETRMLMISTFLFRNRKSVLRPNDSSIQA